MLPFGAEYFSFQFFFQVAYGQELEEGLVMRSGFYNADEIQENMEKRAFYEEKNIMGKTGPALGGSHIAIVLVA